MDVSILLRKMISKLCYAKPLLYISPLDAKCLHVTTRALLFYRNPSGLDLLSLVSELVECLHSLSQDILS
jgi:hypothetical protein